MFIPGKYTTRGKWMDGWESRRKRTPGHDWCVVTLGMRGRIRGFNVNTAFFTGNFPTQCSIEALDTTKPVSAALSAREGLPWVTILPKSGLRGDSDNFFAIDDDRPWTHLRLNIFPDGGVARLRVYGDVVVDWKRVAPRGRVVDLAAIEHGGLVIAASDMHYGAKDNVIMPGRAANMGDGWETKRRRGPGYDWLILRLGAVGTHSQGRDRHESFQGELSGQRIARRLLGAARHASRSSVPRSGTRSCRRRSSRRIIGISIPKELRDPGPVTHVRLNIFPDGGVSRFRVHGTLAAD